MRGAAFHEPRLELWSIAWRLAVAPWPAMWLLTFQHDVRSGDVAAAVLSTLTKTLFANMWLSAIALVVGLPLYILYRRLNWSAWWSYALGAALIGLSTASLVLLQSPAPGGSFSSFSNASGSCDAVVDGVRTNCGWAAVVEALGFTAVFAAVSGLVFWALLRWRKRSTVSRASQ